MTSSTSKMDRYTTTEYGKQNMFASEPPMQYVEDYQGYGPHAEQLNGRLAMIGFFALVHNYILFGAVIPGIFYIKGLLHHQHVLVTFYPYNQTKGVTNNDTRSRKV